MAGRAGNRVRFRHGAPGGAVLVALALLPQPATPQLAPGASATIEFRVRDAETHAAVQARLRVRRRGERARTLFTDEAGRVRLEGAPGRWRVLARALKRGYRPLRTTLTVAPGSVLPVEILLDPRRPPRGEAARARAGAGSSAFIEGWVTDAVSGAPLAGVAVRSATTGAAVRTGDDGFFSIPVPVPAHAGASPDRPPPEETLLFTRAGYVRTERAGILLAPGRITVRVLLEPGQGARRERAVRGSGSGPRSGRTEPPAVRKTPAARATSSAAFLAPPASIRVGRNCSCASCGSVSVMSLETYVKGGLDNEWIASWNAHSLRAGAIAYRTYGAYHVYHPRAAAYDICDTTCCQVYDATTSSAASAAADATSGILLADPATGEPAFAEYSAENNDLDGSNGCGDCYVGRPAHGWSCLRDEVGCGYPLFGHGRGMSQWGTKRWGDPGRDRDWRWMTDHYYNERAEPQYFLTSPVEITAATADPAVVPPGGAFAIDLAGFHHGEAALTAVLVGASLCNPACTVSDPANDRLVTVPPGAHVSERTFEVPQAAATGSYDLLVAYWYDVDGDGAIGPSDLVLGTRREADAVAVALPTATPTPTPGTCAPAPLPGCGTAGASVLRMRDHGDPARRRFVWKWRRGWIDVGALGDPVSGGTDYAVCVYDDGSLVLALAAAAGEPWRPARRGFRYRMPGGNGSGLDRMRLRSGSGDARIVVRARGPALGPHLPLPMAQATGVTVQLVRQDSAGAACWEATFEPPARRNDTGGFQDTW